MCVDIYGGVAYGGEFGWGGGCAVECREEVQGYGGVFGCALGIDLISLHSKDTCTTVCCWRSWPGIGSGWWNLFEYWLI